MLEPIPFDCRWKIVLCAERTDLRTQGSPRYTLTEGDRNRFLKALYDKSNPRCLQYFLLNSGKPALANLKLHYVEFTSDGYLKIIFEIETKYYELLQGCDVETCVYQCLKENSCGDLLLCSERGDIIWPEELLKDYKKQKDVTSQHSNPGKVKVKDFVWDLYKRKKSGAPLKIPKQDIPAFRKILMEGLKQHASQSEAKGFKLHEISFDDDGDSGAKLIVTLNFLIEEEKILQTTINTVEKWVFSSLEQKGYENIVAFYDDESVTEREVSLVSLVSEVVNTQESLSRSLEEEMDITVDQPVPSTNTQDGATAGMTTLAVNESDGKPTGAETNVDHPEELCQDIQNAYVSIEWELKFKETHFLIDEEVSRCREALSNNLNGLLAKEELLGIFIPDKKHDICVRNSSLKIRFAVRNISSGPNINTVSDIIQRCLDQNQLHSITVKRGREVSRN